MEKEPEPKRGGGSLYSNGRRPDNGVLEILRDVGRQGSIGSVEAEQRFLEVVESGKYDKATIEKAGLILVGTLLGEVPTG